MSYFRNDNKPAFFSLRDSAFPMAGLLRRRLNYPHPFDADNVKPHSGGRSQSRTSSGTHETEKPGLIEVGLFRFRKSTDLRRRQLVPPALLGLVQRLVGGSDKSFGRFPMLREGRDAQ